MKSAQNKKQTDIYIYISSCCTISTDISDPLSTPLPIIHCFWQVFRATSSICTEQLYVCSSWTSCFCSSLWRDQQEYITYELIPTSPAVSRKQILRTYSLPEETIAAIMMLYRNTKVKVHSPDGDTDYFDIVAGVLQGDTLVPYLFIICLDYMLRTSVDKINEIGFKLTKERSSRYPAKTITDADYADDIALLANAPAQAETLQHSLPPSASMLMHTRRNICTSIKQATSPH